MSDDYHILRFGHEEEPIAIIDDFASDNEMLIQKASEQTFNLPQSHYPGIRAQASASYLGQRSSLIEDILRKVFEITTGVKLIECNYSMVTHLARTLTPFQRFPHFDGIERGRIAVLHYLCGAEHGGTAFYRHDFTGYETIDESRLKEYDGVRQSEYIREPGNGYPNEQTYGFTQIGSVKAKKNRLIIYRSQMLHSGIIETANLSSNPESGRLTLNSFFLSR